jgi:hypothetical protein
MSGLPIHFDASGISGRADLTGPDPVVAGAHAAWELRYSAGPGGLPPGSALALVRRWPSDWDTPQCETPDAPGYTTVSIDPPAAFRWRTRRSIEWHPFDHVFEIETIGGLPRGATILIASSLRAQTFIEESCALSVRVRLGDKAWVEIARPAVRIVGGPAYRLDLVVPSDIVAGVPFEAALRVEDEWGNPALLATRPALDGEQLTDLPGVLRWRTTRASIGRTRLVADAGSFGHIVSNPTMVHASAPTRRIQWGDIHAQSLVGCGARTLDAFFAHARDFARLDFASHQANCFLVTTPEWHETEAVTERYNETGQFAALLGLEWSADTRKGGDRNLYFPGAQAPITRCSHEYVADTSDIASDLDDADALHAKYRGSDTLVALHVGGRTTDLRWHEPSLERLIEVHSTHATSEWFLFEALERGYRMGVTAGSDGVDGRPGASHPGRQSVRNVRGGLVAAPLSSLSRQGLWEALQARNCYATNGSRIRLEYSADGHAMGSEFAADKAPLLSIAIDGTGPLEAVEIFRSTQIVHSATLRDEGAEASNRIRIAWRGATAPGNFSKARMRWDGSVALSHGRFGAPAPYALDTPDEGIVEVGPQHIAWRSMTGGDWDGIVVPIEAADDAILSIRTPQISATVPFAELPAHFADIKPLRELDVRRLPANLGASNWAGTWRDPAPQSGWNAYWVRVRQWDGAYAWSSPIFVRMGQT